MRNADRKRRKIYCCGCGKKVSARLTNGAEVYPRRKDLHSVPFWKCDTCGNWVGCHWKTEEPTKPLGVIPNREIKEARKYLHALIDPAWKAGLVKRRELYHLIAQQLGVKRFHVAEIRSIDEARTAYRVARTIISNLQSQSR